MDKDTLKELLRSIKDNNYAVPTNVDIYKLSLVMLDNIGDTDSELRDKLILSILTNWINDSILSDKETYNLLMIVLDENHLLNGLGKNDDRVFCRTFSVEVVASIIYRHRMAKFVSKKDIEKAFEKVLKFYNEDIDLRGYVKDKGWAHGAAHGADALDEFARCEEIDYDGLTQILDSIYKKVNAYNYGYIHFEDERIITVVKAILDRKIIPTKEIESWIRNFKNIKKVGTTPEDTVAEFNVNTFLKSLYFRLIYKAEYGQVANVVKYVVYEISKFKEY